MSFPKHKYKRKKLTDEHKHKLRLSKLGRKPHISEAGRQKLSLINLGNSHALGYRFTPEQREKVRQFRLGKKHSEQTRRKMSISQRKRFAEHPMSLESREKMRQGQLKRYREHPETKRKSISN